MTDWVFIDMDIKAIINEEVKTLFENLAIYTIPELAQMLERLNYDQNGINIVTKMLMDEYRKAGDQGVVDMYAKIAGVEIEALRNGRYVFANLVGGGEPMLEIEDNAFHTPDEMPS